MLSSVRQIAFTGQGIAGTESVLKDIVLDFVLNNLIQQLATLDDLKRGFWINNHCFSGKTGVGGSR